jgi:dipeptidyl aminopeptidase/acylaminoacyl peptidase
VPVTNGVTEDVVPSVSSDGRMVFASETSVELLFAMPFDGNGGKPLGPLRPVRADTTPSQRSSISEDGSLLAFPKYEFAAGGLWLKDLRTGQERQLAATPRTPLNPVISNDGRWVAYTETTKETGGNSGPGIVYVMETTNGVARRICDSCSAHLWTRDDRQIVISDAGNPTLTRIDIRTGARTPLVVPSRGSIDRPMFVPGAQWVTFNADTGVQVAPVHPDRGTPESEWVTLVPLERAERTAGMSPDGRLLYLLLERDGFRCLYALALDPATGRARGEPYVVAHFHDAARHWGTTGLGSAVASNVFVAALFETTGNVWMTKLATAR